MKEAPHLDKSSGFAAAEASLVPQKTMLWRVGVSRSTLWRLLKGNPANCPEPVMLRGRVFWRESDIEPLRRALKEFQGRSSFENDRKRERAFHKAAEEKRKISSRRKRKKQLTDAGQLNLFS